MLTNCAQIVVVRSVERRLPVALMNEPAHSDAEGCRCVLQVEFHLCEVRGAPILSALYKYLHDSFDVGRKGGLEPLPTRYLGSDSMGTPRSGQSRARLQIF